MAGEGLFLAVLGFTEPDFSPPTFLPLLLGTESVGYVIAPVDRVFGRGGGESGDFGGDEKSDEVLPRSPSLSRGTSDIMVLFDTSNYRGAVEQQMCELPDGVE